MERILKSSKALLYIATAILIFIFNENVMPFVAFLVGGVVMAYALEELVFLAVQKKVADMAEAVIQIVLAVLLFLVSDDIVKVCIIWGVWSIIREGREMTHALAHVKKQRLALINIAESVVVTVLSAFMVLEPGLHHAHTHVILLGIELILEIGFPLLEKVIELYTQRKKEKEPAKPIE